MIDEYRLIYAGGEKHERGVGLLLDPDISKSVLGHWCVSDRVLLVKLQGHPFNISIIVVYAPTADSADEVIDTFYDSLDKAKSQCKSNDIVIVLGDLNAKVGQGIEGKAVGPHGIGERNERGDRWVQWCETWTLASDTKKRLESCEMWFLRRMMKIPWTDKVSNEEVLTRAGVQRKMIREMLIRQLKFMGHITRKEGLENLALTGKIVGRRSRGRRRILWMDSLQKLLEERGVKELGVVLIQKARSRGLWNSMIAKVKRYGT